MIDLKLKYCTQTGVDIHFSPDGNSARGAREDQEKELRKKYLKFYLRNVFYLPLKTPEEIIWNQEFAANLLKILNKEDYLERINLEPEYKGKFFLIAEAMTGDCVNIHTAEKTFIEKWLGVKNETYDYMSNLILRIRDLPLNG